MTIKASELITDALEEIVVQQEEADVEQAEGRAALRTLNDMMAMWAAQGIYLGYTNLDNLGEDVNIPDGAILGVKAHLGIMLANKYIVPVTPELIMKANKGWEAILSLAVTVEKSQYPDTLPQGSGNDNTAFYSEKL